MEFSNIFFLILLKPSLRFTLILYHQSNSKVQTLNMMNFRRFSERVNLLESLSSFSNEELNSCIKFFDGAQLINKVLSKDSISKDVVKDLLTMEPWIFHLSQQLQLEDKDLQEFKETIIEHYASTVTYLLSFII